MKQCEQCGHVNWKPLIHCTVCHAAYSNMTAQARPEIVPGKVVNQGESYYTVARKNNDESVTWEAR